MTPFVLDPMCCPLFGFDVGSHCKASYNHEYNKKGQLSLLGIYIIVQVS